jgi:hypothetical protein
MRSIRGRSQWLLNAIVLATVAATFAVNMDLLNLSDQVRFFVFQARDLFRAAQLITGHSIFFGPEMTGGGNLPGPFYYWLLAPSQFISPGWESAWIWLVALSIGGAIAVWFFLRARVNLTAALVWITIFSLSIPLVRIIHIFLNVSYALVFTSLILLAICGTFGSNSSAKRHLYFLIACLFSGLAVQLHMSTIAYFLALMFMLIFSPYINLTRPSLKVIGQGLLAFLIPLLPYLYWWTLRSFGKEIGQPMSYSGQSQQAVQSLLYLMKNVSGYSIFHNLLTIGEIVYRSLPLATILLVVTATSLSQKTVARSGSLFVKPIAICAGFGFVPYCYVFFSAVGVRYTLPFLIAILLLTAIQYERVLMSPRRIRLYNWLNIILFIFFLGYIILFHPELINPTHIWACLLLPGAMVTILFLSPSIPKNSRSFIFSLGLTALLGITNNVLLAASRDLTRGPRMMPSHSEWKSIWKEVYSATGWPYELAIHRTYFINHQLEQDPGPSYDAITKENPTPVRNENQPDGFFIAFHLRRFNNSPTFIKNWLLKNNIQSDLKDALLRGDLIVEKSLLEARLVSPYRVINKFTLAQHFHNVGEGYFRDSDEYLLDSLPGRDKIAMLADGRVAFKWNECPDLHNYCTTGALVRVQPTINPFLYQIQVRVVGAPLSQVSPWISPDWTQQWRTPFFDVQCGMKKQRHKIANSVGYGREYAGDATQFLLWGNNSFVAPFERTFEVECKRGLSGIGFGHEGSTVETLYRLNHLPGRHLFTKI